MTSCSPLGAGLAADLGARFPEKGYGLLRLKVAQTFFLEGRPWRWEMLKKAMLDSLAAVGGEE